MVSNKIHSIKTGWQITTWLIMIISLFIGTMVFSQNADIWGVTSSGAEYGSGNLFKVDSVGENHTIQHEFHKEEGTHAFGTGVVEASNGKLYGMTTLSGLHYGGVIFEYDPQTDDYVNVYDLDDTLGRFPRSKMIEANDGLLYGMTSEGGLHDHGVIFTFDPVTHAYSKLYDFDGMNGSKPQAELLQADNGRLYGMTLEGGMNNDGVIFEYDIQSSAYIKLIDFDSIPIGSSPFGKLIQASDGLLYGMTKDGGANSSGVLFSLNPNSQVFAVHVNFQDYINGEFPFGGLTEGNNGTLYGMTSSGGNYNYGTIFGYDITSESIASIFHFNNVLSGSVPLGDVIISTDNYLYGLTSFGGAHEKGTLFKFDINTDTFTKHFDFDIVHGSRPTGSLTAASNGKLYGLTSGGGLNVGTYSPGNGVLYEFDVNADQYDVVQLLGESLEGYGSGGIVQAGDGMIYGVASFGGIHHKGVIYKIDPENPVYTKLYDFGSGNSGKFPFARLLEAPNGKLYGVTSSGGLNDLGILFEFDPASNAFTKKIDFDGASHGSLPMSPLMLASNGKIYGSTATGGTMDDGVLFQYDYVNNTLVKILDFDEFTSGKGPQAALCEASDGKLYGTTRYGGVLGYGGMFVFDPSTNSFDVLTDFYGISNGSQPLAEMKEYSNGMLYGTTMFGGVYDKGILFTYDFEQNVLTKLMDFNGINGDKPVSELLLAENGKFYGTTTGGGDSDSGVLFEYDPQTDTYMRKFDFSIHDGYYPNRGLIQLVEPEDTVGLATNLELFALNDIRVFPNPSKGHVILQQDQINYTTASLVDFDGRVVNHFEIHKTEAQLDLSDYAAGVYFIHLFSEKTNRIIRLVLE